jgi:NAD(P)-dependent dehydrogenase (short-subunit alcohol dehydrogenase family)
MTGLFDLTGKTALVTGSSGGLGLAMARGLAEAGAGIVLNGRDRPKLAAAAEARTKLPWSLPSRSSTRRRWRSTSW